MGWNLLVLDDEASVIQALQIMIDREAFSIHEVFTADNGRDGLAVMRERGIDLVLLDMHMPVMDGAAFLKVACECFPETKYIVISNYSDLKYTRQSIASNAVDYILKPIDVDELNSAMKKAVCALETERQRRRETNTMRQVAAEVRPLMRRQVYESYLKGHKNDYNIQKYEEMLVLEKRPERNAVLLLRVVNFRDICRTLFQDDFGMTCYAFINVIEEALDNFGCVCISDSDTNDDFAGIMGIPEAADRDSENLEEQIASCMEILAKLFGAKILAAAGDITDTAHLRDSYESAKNILRQTNRQKEGKVFFSDSFCREKIDLLYDMKNYIRENYNQELHMEDLEKRYFMTKEHLSKLFKNSFGSTPYDFLIQCRMEKAQDLLTDPNRSIVSVADKLGYSNVNYFSKAFRKYYGVSPSGYRKRLSEKREDIP